MVPFDKNKNFYFSDFRSREKVLAAMNTIVRYLNNEDALELWIDRRPKELDEYYFSTLANDEDAIWHAVTCFKKIITDFVDVSQALQEYLIRYKENGEVKEFSTLAKSKEDALEHLEELTDPGYEVLGVYRRCSDDN